MAVTWDFNCSVVPSQNKVENRKYLCQLRPFSSSSTTFSPYTTPPFYPGCPSTLTCIQILPNVTTRTPSSLTTSVQSTTRNINIRSTSATTILAIINSSPTSGPTQTAASVTSGPTTKESTTTIPITTKSTSTIPTTTESITTIPITTKSTSTIPTATKSTSTIPTATESTTISRFDFNMSIFAALLADDSTANVYNCPASDHVMARFATSGNEIFCQEIFDDHCLNSPCKNNATCHSQMYIYRCVCQPGYSDPECMTKINLCENYPCDPFGSCTPFLNGYQCTCKKGFQYVNSTYCVDIDECSLNSADANVQKCSNSNCSNYPGGYECLCPLDKLGRFCETDDLNITISIKSINVTSGPEAGGGPMRFVGPNIAFYPVLGAYFVPRNMSLETLFGYYQDIGNQTDEISITIPRAPNDKYINQRMDISLKYSNNKNVSSTLIAYTYTVNPLISHIKPSDILIAYGITLQVTGQYFASLDSPILNMEIKYTRMIYKFRVICVVKNDTYMTCTLPIIDVNETTINSNTSLIYPNISMLGFFMYNYVKYSNLRWSLPRYDYQTNNKGPILHSKANPIDYDPEKGVSFEIDGENLDIGLTKGDYVVHMGTDICFIEVLNGDQLVCRPPNQKPFPTKRQFSCNYGDLPVLVDIASRKNFFYGCIKYANHNSRWALIIGLTVGLVGLLILVIVAVWILFYFAMRKGEMRGSNGNDNSQIWNEGMEMEGREEGRDSYIGIIEDSPTGERRRQGDDPNYNNRSNVAPNYTLRINRAPENREHGSEIISASQVARDARDYYYYGQQSEGGVVVPKNIKKKVFGDFLKPKERISYTRPNKKLVESDLSTPFEDDQRRLTYGQVYHRMKFSNVDEGAPE